MSKMYVWVLERRFCSVGRGNFSCELEGDETLIDGRGCEVRLRVVMIVIYQVQLAGSFRPAGFFQQGPRRDFELLRKEPRVVPGSQAE